MMLSRICKNCGVRLASYQDCKELIQAMGLTEAASRCAGLAVYFDGRFAILYDRARPPEEIRFIVAHELGHIMLGHLTFRSELHERLPGRMEREADLFAVHLIAVELGAQSEDHT